MEARHFLFALSQLEGIGWKTVGRLVQQMSSLCDLPLLGLSDLVAMGIPAKRAETIIQGVRPQVVERRMEECLKAGIGWITVWDREYPELLKQIAQPPWVLYCRGKLSLLQKPGLAVVGTRLATVYGKKVASELSRALSDAGICIVSGLARGIDAAAHQGALAGKGGTVAVLGAGIEQVYPPENKPLYEEIAAQGLLLSEMPPGTRPHPGLFPLRNRIIAGMTLGTLVVEAAERSGALITADLALESGRDVFAVPGPITSPQSRGTLALIKQGAKTVTSVEDILEEYMHMITTSESTYIRNKEEEEEGTEEERRILALLSCEPMSIDELFERTQINFGLLHSVLINLLMKKKIEQLPGSSYIAL